MHVHNRSSRFRGVAIAVVMLSAGSARAQEAVSEADAAPRMAPGLQLSLKLEPGLAVALTDPQAELTELGFRQTIKVLVGLSRFIAVGPSFAFATLPATPAMTSAGTAWAVGATARLERPRDARGGRFDAMSPWIDADLLYVRTGSLNRPGLAAGAGLAVPIDPNRKFWIGPFVRYSQILQGGRPGFDTRDAKILSIGLSFEVGAGLDRKRERTALAEPVTEPVAAVAVAEVADRDGDAVADDADACPDVAGLVENAGCPVAPQVAVAPDQLELEEKISFEWNTSTLDASSTPALDEVVRALQANRDFKVEVDGHASSDGDSGYNQTLSERRAEAVLAYLVSRGVARDRLVAKGFGSTAPIEPNSTLAGRESNRRVEFVASFIIKKAS